MTKNLLRATAALLLAVGLLAAAATPSEARDTQWGGRTHHSVR